MAYNRKEEYLAVVKQPRQITDELLETIDYIAQARDAELSFDKTIIAEIVSLNNADTGEYFVEYQKVNLELMPLLELIILILKELMFM